MKTRILILALALLAVPAFSQNQAPRDIIRNILQQPTEDAAWAALAAAPLDASGAQQVTAQIYVKWGPQIDAALNACLVPLTGSNSDPDGKVATLYSNLLSTQGHDTALSTAAAVTGSYGGHWQVQYMQARVQYLVGEYAMSGSSAIVAMSMASPQANRLKCFLLHIQSELGAGTDPATINAEIISTWQQRVGVIHAVTPDIAALFGLVNRSIMSASDCRAFLLAVQQSVDPVPRNVNFLSMIQTQLSLLPQ